MYYPPPLNNVKKTALLGRDVFPYASSKFASSLLFKGKRPRMEKQRKNGKTTIEWKSKTEKTTVMNVVPASPFCVFSKFDNHIRRRKKRPTVAPRRPLTFIHHNSFAIFELKMWLPFELLPPDLPEENHATSPLLQMTFGIVTDEKRLCKAQLFVSCFI